MKELKVGEKITLEVIESSVCANCFFENKEDMCNADIELPCSSKIRSDHKNVIFKEVKE